MPEFTFTVNYPGAKNERLEARLHRLLWIDVQHETCRPGFELPCKMHSSHSRIEPIRYPRGMDNPGI